MKKHMRKIVRVDSRWHEAATVSQKAFVWKATEVHTMTLECGHRKVQRGGQPPKQHALCKDCEKGKEPVAVTVQPGRFRVSQKPPKSPLARGLVPGGMKR